MLVSCTSSQPHVELTEQVSCLLPSWGPQALGKLWLMLDLQMRVMQAGGCSCLDPVLFRSRRMTLLCLLQTQEFAYRDMFRVCFRWLTSHCACCSRWRWHIVM